MTIHILRISETHFLLDNPEFYATVLSMKNSNYKSQRKARNRVAIYYKSHGEFIGPYENITFSKKEIESLKADGTLQWVSNYVLRSPLQFRRRTA